MKLTALFSALLFGLASVSFSPVASANVMNEMFQMNRELGTLLRADSVADFQQGADGFLQAAKQAQQTMPASLDDDQTKFKGYQQGMQEVIDVVSQAKQLAEQGQLTEAKAMVEKLTTLKKMYHSEYK